jgi:hypothetical protein
MMAKINLSALNSLRLEKLKMLEEQRLNIDDFANATFGFLVKNHVKPVSKPHNKTMVLTNYIYWVTYIERKIALERALISVGLGSEELLRQAMKLYLKRRDKMVIRLLGQLKEDVREIYSINDKFVEIILSNQMVIHTTKNALKEINVSPTIAKDTIYPEYVRNFVINF